MVFYAFILVFFFFLFYNFVSEWDLRPMALSQFFFFFPYQREVYVDASYTLNFDLRLILLVNG